MDAAFEDCDEGAPPDDDQWISLLGGGGGPSTETAAKSPSEHDENHSIPLVFAESVEEPSSPTEASPPPVSTHSQEGPTRRPNSFWVEEQESLERGTATALSQEHSTSPGNPTSGGVDLMERLGYTQGPVDSSQNVSLRHDQSGAATERTSRSAPSGINSQLLGSGHVLHPQHASERHGATAHREDTNPWTTGVPHGGQESVEVAVDWGVNRIFAEPPSSTSPVDQDPLLDSMNAEEVQGMFDADLTEAMNNSLADVPPSHNLEEEQLRAAMQASLEEATGQPRASPRASERVVNSLPVTRIRQHHLDANESCEICCQTYKLADAVVHLPCKHGFHRNCINTWLRKHCSCPTCRWELETDDPEFERGRLERMHARLYHELDRLSMDEIQSLLPTNHNCHGMQHSELVNYLKGSRRSAVDPSPRGEERSVESLRQLSIPQLRQVLLETYGPSFGENLMTKDDIINALLSGGRRSDVGQEATPGPFAQASHAEPSPQPPSPSVNSHSSPTSRISNLQVRNSLYKWFSQEMRVSIGAHNYVTWDNGGPCHLKRFSSIFVDPTSGECFPSARYGSEDQYVVEETDPELTSIIWFFNKKGAETAAAARAYDCLQYRQSVRLGVPYEAVCLETPSVDRLNLPDNLPPDVLERIKEVQASFRR